MSLNQYIYIRQFNDKVKSMVQARSNSLTLTSDEALKIQNNIFDLLAQLAEATRQEQETSQVTVKMDGGTF